MYILTGIGSILFPSSEFTPFFLKTLVFERTLQIVKKIQGLPWQHFVRVANVWKYTLYEHHVYHPAIYPV